ncbi:hypothetical protein TCAL_05739 [Tigriopus californicus]|uniref:Protein arginine N-methyltransferase n=1 Tax=Tigriopus californicus TaxID=6832 RepID=A0A553N6L1_TIGCA|nr:protein arginine N-methyltransferase 7-like [Tigriopus californicus]TRY61040.1 hypothetical protein TCAL_05739 [Tigriopus californicus]
MWLSRLRGMVKMTQSKGSVFLQTLNPMTGQTEWQMRPPDYDYQQEVARAAFADMLHDTERNKLYYEALKIAIRLKREQGQPVHVLDIGTGTGLLSMMAARIGADSITAIEEFRPMANCAEKVIRDNGFADQIKLVRKRSTYVTVGQGQDMAQKANILVTEVFDTELIGEGAIGTFNHAHENLLTPDCMVVPSFGTMFAQVVSSDLCSRWNTVQPIKLSDQLSLDPPDEEVDGISFALHDVQMSQVQETWFTPITKPVPVFNFDFTGRSGPLPVNDMSCLPQLASVKGKCDAIFIWWELKMDPLSQVTLSCAPKWAHPNPKDIPWRDHWMQAIYYPMSQVHLNEGESFNLISRHDEYSLFFDVSKTNTGHANDISGPPSKRGIQWAVSRLRLGQMNDPERNAKLVQVIKNALNQVDSNNGSSWLFLGELSFMPLMAAKLGAPKVVLAEGNTQMIKVLKAFAKKHDLQERLVIIEKPVVELTNKDLAPYRIEVVLTEPYFSASLLPWHNLLFWYSLNEVLPGGDSDMEYIRSLPQGASIWAVPVAYKDLWKIRSPLHDAEGFKMTHFDEIIMQACDESDADVEPHPLWEYPCRASGQAIKLMDFEFAYALPEQVVQKQTTLEVASDCNGMALWMEWHLDDETTISNGPKEPVEVGDKVNWDMHSHQGVSFLPQHQRGRLTVNSMVQCTVTFNPKEGDLAFQFSVVE